MQITEAILYFTISLLIIFVPLAFFNEFKISKTRKEIKKRIEALDNKFRNHQKQLFAMKEILQQIARKHNMIGIGAEVAIKQHTEADYIKELKCMIRDNEKMMVSIYGFEIVNEIKNM